MNYAFLFRQAPLSCLLVLLVGYLLSPFFDYRFDPGGFNDQRVLQLVFVTLCLLAVVFASACRRDWVDFWNSRSTPVKSLLVIFFAVSMLSSLLAPVPWRGLQETGLYAAILLSVITLGGEFKRIGPQALRDLLALAIGLWLVSYALYFLIYYISVYVAEPTRYLSENRWLPNFYNRRSFNQVEIWLLPAFFWLCLRLKSYSPVLKVGVYVSISLWWVMLFYSLGRGVSLSLVVATLGVMLIFRHAAGGLLLAALTTSVVGLALYLAMFIAPPYLLFGDTPLSYLERLQNTASSARLELWNFAWQSFLQNPVFGIGPQHYSYFHQDHGHAHNLVLNSMAELGLVGTLPMIGLALIAGWTMIRHATASRSPLEITLVYGLFGVAVYGQFTAQFYFPASQLLLIWFAALALACFDRGQTETAAESNSNSGSLPGMSTLAVLAALTVSCLVVSFNDLQKQPHALYQVSQFNFPRFWLNGDFRRFADRVPAKSAFPCKVHPYAPVFACH